jgi:hypothetical protein
LIDVCVDGAKNGDFSDCRTSTDPTTRPEYKEGERAVASYLASGRIVKMRTFVIGTGAEVSYASALESCKNIDGRVNRLPTEEEAARLAPFVAGYAGGKKKSIWIADTPSCKFAASAMPFYQNPLDATRASTTSCEPWSLFTIGARSVVCVPQSGPIGKRDDL